MLQLLNSEHVQDWELDPDVEIPNSPFSSRDTKIAAARSGRRPDRASTPPSPRDFADGAKYRTCSPQPQTMPCPLPSPSPAAAVRNTAEPPRRPCQCHGRPRRLQSPPWAPHRSQRHGNAEKFHPNCTFLSLHLLLLLLHSSRICWCIDPLISFLAIFDLSVARHTLVNPPVY